MEDEDAVAAANNALGAIEGQLEDILQDDEEWAYVRSLLNARRNETVARLALRMADSPTCCLAYKSRNGSFIEIHVDRNTNRVSRRIYPADFALHQRAR